MSSEDIARLSIAVDSTSVRSATSDMQNMTKVGMGMATALGNVFTQAAAWAKNFAKETMLLAARYDTLGVVMQVAGRNAGYSAQQMMGLEATLRRTGISALESRQSLASMATANIDLAQSSKLARAAQDLAVVGNINSSEAFGRLIHGIQSGNSVILRTLGLNIQFDDSYKSLAQTLHKSAGDLTDQERTLARTNAVLEGAAGYTGIYEQAMDKAGKQAQTMTRLTEDLMVTLGGVFQPVYAEAVDTLSKALKGTNKTLDEGKESIEQWGLRIKAFAQVAVVGAGALALIHAAMKVPQLIDWADAKLKCISASKAAAGISKIEAKGAAELAVIRKMEVLAMYDEAMATNRLTLEKLAAAQTSGNLTAAEYAEAAGHVTNRLALLGEAKAAVVATNATRTLGVAIKTLPGIGWLTALIAVGTLAWGYFQKRSLEEEANEKKRIDEQKEKVAELHRERIAAMVQNGSAIAGMVADGTGRLKDGAVAQHEWNKAIEKAIDILPSLRRELNKLQDGSYTVRLTGEALTPLKLAEANLKAAEALSNAAESKLREIQWRPKKDKRKSSYANELAQAETEAANARSVVIAASNAFVAAENNVNRAKASHTDEQTKFLEGLKKEIDLLGASREVQIRYEATKLGLFDGDKKAAQAVEDLISKYKKQEAIVKQRAETDRLREQKTALLDKVKDKEREIADAGLTDSQRFKKAVEEEIATLQKKLKLKDKDFAETRQRLGNAVTGMEELEKKSALTEAVNAARGMGLNLAGLEAALLKQQNEQLGKQLEKWKEQGVITEDVASKLKEQSKAKRLEAPIREFAPEYFKEADEAKRIREAKVAINEYVESLDNLTSKEKELAAARLTASAYENLTDWGRKAREIKDALDPMRSYRRELALIKEAYKDAMLSSDEYGKALNKLNVDTMRALADQGDAMAQMGVIVQGTGDRMNDALVNWMNNLDGVGRSWVTLRDTMRRVIGDMLLDMERAIMKKYVFDVVFGAIGGMFGPSGGNAYSASNFSSLPDYRIIPSVSGPKAAGGSVLPGSTYLVGERGPELFVSKTAGAIIPNNRLAQGGGAGETHVTIVQHISAGNSDSKVSGGGSQPWAQMAKGIEGMVKETIRKEQRQGGSLNPVFSRGGGL